MEGTPSPQRQRDPGSLIDLNYAPDLTRLRASIIAMVSDQLQHANVFIALANETSGELRFEGPELWLDSFLQRHGALKIKLQNGELASIASKELSTPRPADAVPSNVLLVPMVSETSLRGVIGVISLTEGKQLSLEELESLRYIAQLAAPIVNRLQEIERLLARTRKFDALARQLQTTVQNLRAAEKESGELGAMIRMRAHFQANVAHDIRTPLAAIRGYSRMILDGRAGEINQTQKEYLTVITDNTDRLIHLLNWISQVSDQSSLHLTLSTFDLVELWAACVKNQEDRMRVKSIRLQQQIPDEPFVLIGDKERLAHVLEALLSSAVRFARESADVIVQFAHGREKDISVKILSDAGDGIPPAILDHIFDRVVSHSQSGPATVPRSEAAELNLSEVRDTVGIHGGRIFVTSRTGEGSTFIVTLPSVRKDGEERPGHEQAVNSGRRRR